MQNSQVPVTAILSIDIQNTFMDGGPLAVADANSILPFVNKQLRDNKKYHYRIASMDWHPLDHLSFAVNHPGKNVYQLVDLYGLQQVLWPVHGVMNTLDAQLHKDLDKNFDAIITKGSNREIDSYSCFFDNGQRHDTGLHVMLKKLGVTHVVLVGLALDYCVKFSAIDAVQLGYHTTVLVEGTRAVNINPGDGDKAIAEMKALGIVVR